MCFSMLATFQILQFLQKGKFLILEFNKNIIVFYVTKAQNLHKTMSNIYKKKLLVSATNEFNFKKRVCLRL